MIEPSSISQLSEPPLCVDLDGTLIRTDILYESLLLMVKQQPLTLLQMPMWLLGGKAALKRNLAERVTLNAATLPYHEPLLDYLRSEKHRGRKLILATAADQGVAVGIASELGLFDEVLASDGRINLSGARKRDALLNRFGRHGYDYAGNSRVDLPLWRECRQAIVVSSRRSLVQRVGSVSTILHHFNGPDTGFRVVARAIRVHQWVKNLLVFVPLFTSHMLGSPERLLHAVFAFFCFSFAASASYIINDLLDLESDRQHQEKCRRPLASGALPIQLGIALVPLLLIASGALALGLPGSVAALTIGYFTLSICYSLLLKSLLLIDVFILAGLYTLRILAGNLATGIHASYWLLAFSMFIFLSLALLKRVSELSNLRVQNRDRAKGRAYEAGDLELVSSFGIASGYLSALVLALYFNSQDVIRIYQTPSILWALCPLLLYWISRMWLLAHRGQMNEDPIVFAIKDRISHVIGACFLLVAWIATGDWSWLRTSLHSPL